MKDGRNGILRAGHNCLDIFDSPLCGLFVDAADYYRAFAEAARKARRFVLIAGWQFDSEVRLVRPQEGGSDLPEADSLLSFLNLLCTANPELEIYILSWDYSAIFALEREWFQSRIFAWKTPSQVHFRFDASHAVGASHHQKFVVVDGQIAFVGGMDICASRWDDRRHRWDNPLRVLPSGAPYGPYHDVQAFVSGAAALAVTEIFRERWAASGAADLRLPVVSPSDRLRPHPPLPIAAVRVAVSRTQSETIVPVRPAVSEIRQLYLDAIASADALIYIENQYFCSQAVYEALMKRMSEEDRPPLTIVMILPQRLSGVIENLSMGLAQARMLNSLSEEASRRGHAFGLYYPAASGSHAGPVYVHSKVLIVDDRFMTVGSANTTNRSMGLDTELNVSWEDDGSSGDGLAQSIRRIRVDLLGEHTGAAEGYEERLSGAKGLVDALNRMADAGDSRLRRLQSRDYLRGNRWLRDIPPEELTIDLEFPVVEENIFEVIAHDKSGRLARLLLLLNRLLRKESTPLPRHQAKRSRLGRLTLLGRVAIGGLILLVLAIIAAVAALF